MRDLHVSIARAWSLHNQACGVLRQAVRRDRNSYLDSLVKNVSLADLRRPKQFFQQVRKAFPKAASAKKTRFVALPAVELPDGTIASTTEERVQRWRQHFSEQESGTPVNPSEYRHLLAKKDRCSSCTPVTMDAQLLPSLLSLENTILDLKRAKAAGADGLIAELFKVMPAEAARQLFVLHLKCTLSLREPIEYKGGALITIAKKAAAAFGCNQHRSILISSVPGKILHRGIRSRLEPMLSQVSPDLHDGVRAGRGVHTVSLAVRSFQARETKSERLPGFVFYDARAVYYQVLREYLTGEDLDNRVLLRLFCTFGVPDSAYADLKAQLSRLAVLAESGCTPHATALLREVFKGTWFRMDQHPPVCRYCRRCSTGRPAC